jgi:hypothetical protein
MTTWVKPNKTEIELNDAPATVEAAKALGWEKKKGRKPAAKKKAK